MSSRIQVAYSSEDYEKILAAMSPEDRKALFDIAMKRVVDDFMKNHHLLVSMGCEITIPCSHSTLRKPVSPTEPSDKGGDQDEE